MPPDLSISIVHHKNRELLEQCLDSVFRETSVRFEVFVIDNCSNDGTPELIKSKYPNIKLIQNEKPEGFARNHNKALRMATGRYLLILNDDTVILNHALDKMVEFMDVHPQVSILVCKMHSEDGSLQDVARKRFPTPFRLFIEDLYGMSGLKRIFLNNWIYNALSMGIVIQDKSMEVAHVSGACMLIREEVRANVGLLDEQFFMFLEETDFCYRTKRAGWQIYYYPKAEIIHYGAKSLSFFNKERARLFKKSMRVFLKKHYGMRSLILYEFLEILLVPIKQVHALYLKLKYRDEISKPE